MRPRTHLTDDWGVSSGYEDAKRTWRPIAAATRQALHRAMRIDPSEASAAGEIAAYPVVVRQGASRSFAPGARVQLEDGADLPADQLADAPLGYHRLEEPDGVPRRLIVAPACCHLPDDLAVWGWAAQLYAVRSAASWGMGDLADLRALARWSRELGAKLLLVNPLGAAAPAAPQESSPYSPCSRRFRNLLYLRMEDVPGADNTVPGFEQAAQAGQALNGQPRIDREAIFRLKYGVLKALWARFAGDPAFERFLADQGEPLWTFSTYCALAELHGRDWRAWPAALRHPGAPEVREFSRQQQPEVRFHAWVQWLLDEQLSRAATELPLMQDLPIGSAPDGADAWAWQDLLAEGAAVGAPPDVFNPLGQNWALPPFVPHLLRAAGYEPFIQIIRASLRHAGGLRIDHVMGLFRLFWIPDGFAPGEGGYVRYPADELLAIVALESQRAGAVIAGEDLGTLEDGVRQILESHRLLSYRLLWFEEHPPASYPRQSLASVSTHDLPTIAGLWSGADFRAQQELGLAPAAADVAKVQGRLVQLAQVQPHNSEEEVITSTYRALGRAGSAVVVAALEDALAVRERPNMPGTIWEWPNWSQALPASLEQLCNAPLARSIAEELNSQRGSIARVDQRRAAGKQSAEEFDGV